MAVIGIKNEKLELNSSWFRIIDGQSSYNWLIGTLLEVVECDSQVLGVKSNFWKA